MNQGGLEVKFLTIKWRNLILINIQLFYVENFKFSSLITLTTNLLVPEYLRSILSGFQLFKYSLQE